jgi:hypothetical protein
MSTATNSQNIQVMRDGFRNFVVRVTGEIDLTTAPADVLPIVIANVSTMNPPCQAVRVDRVKFSLPNGIPLDLQLYWQATTNELFWGMGGGDDNEFANFGGLTNNASPGATGNIMFATTGVTGLAPVTTGTETWTYACIVECTKLQPQYPL